MSRKILVTGARAPVALEWCRALSNLGYLVYCADSLRLNLTRFSNSVEKFFFLPEPSSKPREYIKAINSICDRYGINLVLPTCEEIFYLAWGKNDINSNTEVLSNGIELLRRIHSKYEFSHLVEKMSISCPETYRLCSRDQLKSYFDSCKDYVFKPEYSRFATETLIQPSVKELASIKISPMKPWVAQIHVEGTEYATCGFANHGELVFNSIYRPMYRFGKGSGTYFSPVTKPKIDVFVRNFCKRYEIHGQIGFDFIEDHSGNIFVLEGNPRTTSGIHLIKPRLNLSDSAIRQQRSRVKSPSMIAAATLLSRLVFRFPHMFSIAFWQDFFVARDVVYSRKDRFPSVAQYFCFFEILLRAILRYKKLTSAATHDIEWNGDRIGP